MASPPSVERLVDFSEVVGNISEEAGQNLVDALLITALRLPYILQQTIPFIALFSAMVALIALNRRHELVVARAAGISVWQFIMPFVVGAALLGAQLVERSHGKLGHVKVLDAEQLAELRHRRQLLVGVVRVDAVHQRLRVGLGPRPAPRDRVAKQLLALLKKRRVFYILSVGGLWILMV